MARLWPVVFLWRGYEELNYYGDDMDLVFPGQGHGEFGLNDNAMVSWISVARL